MLPVSLCAVGFVLTCAVDGRSLEPSRSSSKRPPQLCVSQSEAQLAQFLVQETLESQPGWEEGSGVELEALPDLIDEWSDDEDEEFRTAIDTLVDAGYITVVEGTLYLPLRRLRGGRRKEAARRGDDRAAIGCEAAPRPPLGN